MNRLTRQPEVGFTYFTQAEQGICLLRSGGVGDPYFRVVGDPTTPEQAIFYSGPVEQVICLHDLPTYGSMQAIRLRLAVRLSLPARLSLPRQTQTFELKRIGTKRFILVPIRRQEGNNPLLQIHGPLKLKYVA